LVNQQDKIKGIEKQYQSCAGQLEKSKGDVRKSQQEVADLLKNNDILSTENQRLSEEVKQGKLKGLQEPKVISNVMSSDRLSSLNSKNTTDPAHSYELIQYIRNFFNLKKEESEEKIYKKMENL